MYALEKNGPSVAREMIDLAQHLKGFTVVLLAYNGNHRTYSHRTLKAAFRRLGSCISGKLSRNGEHAAAIVTPDKHVINWTEAKREIAR